MINIFKIAYFFHINDMNYEYKNIEFRVSITLKGPGTLLYKLSEHEDKRFESYQIAESNSQIIDTLENVKMFILKLLIA